MGLGHKRHGKKSDKETQSPVLKIFRDIMNVNKNDNENKNLIKTKHQERKKKHFGIRAKEKPKPVESSESEKLSQPPYERQNEVLTSEYDHRTQSMPIPSEKKDSWLLWGQTESRPKACSEDTFSCVSCALKRIIGSEYACMSCLVIVCVISILAICSLLCSNIPVLAGDVSDLHSEGDRLKRKIVDMNGIKWNNILSRGNTHDYDNIAKSFKTTEKTDTIEGYEDNVDLTRFLSGSELGKYLTPEKLQHIQQDEHLRQFYKMLIIADAEVRSLKKGKIESPSENIDHYKYNVDDFKYTLNSYRNKRAIKNHQPIGSLHFKHRKRHPIVTGKMMKKIQILKEEQRRLRRNKRQDKIETSKLANNASNILYITKKVAKCSHTPKESKSHEKQLKHPFYQNSQRLDELLDQFGKYEKVTDRQNFYNIFGKDRNGKTKCIHETKEKDFNNNLQVIIKLGDKPNNIDTKNSKITEVEENVAKEFENQAKSDVLTTGNGCKCPNCDCPQKHSNYGLAVSPSGLPGDKTTPIVDTNQKLDAKTIQKRNTEVYPTVRKLLQTNNVENSENTITYEDIKEVLSDYKTDDEGDYKHVEKRNTSGFQVQKITPVEVSTPKYTPINLNNPNWKGPMPLYPDELSLKTKTSAAQDMVGEDEGDLLGDLYAEEVGGGKVPMAQAYSDYGVFEGRLEKVKTFAQQWDTTADDKSAKTRVTEPSQDHAIKKMSYHPPQSKTTKKTSFLSNAFVYLHPRKKKGQKIKTMLPTTYNNSEAFYEGIKPEPNKLKNKKSTTPQVVEDIISNLHDIETLSKRLHIKRNFEVEPEYTNLTQRKLLSFDDNSTVFDENSTLLEDKDSVFDKKATVFKATVDDDNSTRTGDYKKTYDAKLTDDDKTFHVNISSRSVNFSEIYDPKLERHSSDNNSESMAEFFKLLSNWFLFLDGVEITTEYVKSDNTSYEPTSTINTLTSKLSSDPNLEYPMYDSDMIDNIDHRSRVLLSLNKNETSKHDDENTTQKSGRNTKTTKNIEENSNKKGTREELIQKILGPSNKLNRNRTKSKIVKRNIHDDLIFWNNIYDDEYGVYDKPNVETFRSQFGSSKSVQNKSDDESYTWIKKQLKSLTDKVTGFSFNRNKQKKILTSTTTINIPYINKSSSEDGGTSKENRLYNCSTTVTNNTNERFIRRLNKPVVPVACVRAQYIGVSECSLCRVGFNGVINMCRHSYNRQDFFFFIEWMVNLTNPGVRVIEPPKASDMAQRYSEPVGTNFASLTERMKHICKETAMTLQHAKNTSIRDIIKNADNVVTTSMMQHLVNLMSELVDYQVEQKTCKKLPPDLQKFLLWLLDEGKDKKNQDSPAAIETLNVPENTDMTTTEDTISLPTYSNLDVVNKAEGVMRQCIHTLKSLEVLQDIYALLPEDEKENLSGVNEYLDHQIHYLKKRLSMVDYSMLRDVPRLKRSINSTSKRLYPKLKRHQRLYRFLNNLTKKHTAKPTVHDFEGSRLKERKVVLTNKNNIFNLEGNRGVNVKVIEKKNLRDVYYKAVAESKKVTTDKNKMTPSERVAEVTTAFPQ